jgi:GxxExxY protein|tara:strand:+ start:1372 stop:1749 length:378 start_codon:yes stop_codon:yes gene_type:complete
MDIEKIVDEIFTTLGPGYSERVYHTAVEVMLREHHVPYESERNIQIPFKGHIIGYLRADIIIDNSTILEFKTIKTLNEAVEMQGLNYLKLTGLQTAYLINFPPFRGARVEVKKICIENDDKEKIS